MILLSLVAFVMATFGAGFIIRWMRGHSSVYGNSMPQRFHLGDVPRLGGAAILLGLCCSWGLGAAQSLWWGDPGALRLGGGVELWLMVLLPAAVSGIAEDLTQRVAVRYRLAFTGVSGLLAISLLDMTVPRLGLPWLDALLSAAPWLGLCIALLAVTGYHMPSTSLTVTTAWRAWSPSLSALPWPTLRCKWVIGVWLRSWCALRLRLRVFWCGTIHAACCSQVMAALMSGG